MNPKEMRSRYSGMSALEMAINESWNLWIETLERLSPNHNWSDFMDGCFSTDVDENHVYLTINRESYYGWISKREMSDLLEQALFDVFRIPFIVVLSSTEGMGLDHD